VTAGGTQEPIDPVRYITNASSGKMGYAVAEAARDRGASVTLISAPTALRPPSGLEFVPVRTAAEMLERVLEACAEAHVLVMAAAVADYRVAQVSQHKLKKYDGERGLTLELVKNPDILRSVAERFESEGLPVRVGFAAETEDLIANARAKLRTKGVDFVVANDVTAPGSGFGTETNQVVLVHADGEEELPLLSKYAVAGRILDFALGALHKRQL
jgi:phosphopantothenoylcysteine decarboxylase / phosphopantothenate---cysteine ligase